MDHLFPCTQCGLCCRNIGGIEELAQFDRGDGVCIHLKEDRCLIYPERPEICRVDVMYDHYYQSHYTRQQFYEENLKVCKELQIKHGWIEEG